MSDETILKPIGVIPDQDATGQGPEATPELFNKPLSAAQENFDVLEPVIQDVLAARGSSASLADKLAGVDKSIGDLATSDAVSISSALKRAWSLSDEGYAAEQFSPNMTLIKFESIKVLRTVIGDDTVDVESNETLKVGATYLISDSTGRESVTVAEKLEDNRFKATASLTRAITNGSLGQTDWQVGAGYAYAPDGGVYYSSAISVLSYYNDGRMAIRRDSGKGQFKVYVRNIGGDWQEATLLETREEAANTKDDIFQLPVGGVVELKIVADGATRVEDIMVYTSPTAGRAYPIDQPKNLTPAHGAVSVVDPVTFTGTAPFSLYGKSIVSATILIATDKGLKNVIHTGTVENPSGPLSYTAPGGTVEVDKNYWWGFFYTDEDGNVSLVSVATGFSTAGIFQYVVPPMILSPANDATGVMAPLTVDLSDFAVFGAEDTHAASKVIASYNADMSNPFFDSGEVAVGEKIEITEPDGLQVTKDVYLEAFHKGTALGLSTSGPICHVKMADKFQLNYWGDGSDGDVVIAANTAIPNALNGDMVVKNYTSLTINAGATLSVENACRGLMIYVDGDCTINGNLSFDNKGACSFDLTTNTASDGAAMPTTGLVLAKHKDGGGAFGVSNLQGCGQDAVNAEGQQSAVSHGYVLTLGPDCCGAGGDGGNGGSGGGAGGKGANANFAGGSGGGGGSGSYSGGTGGGGAGGAGRAGDGVTANVTPGGHGGAYGTGGAAGVSSNAGPGSSNGVGGMLLLFVRGTLSGSGKITSSSPNAGGGYGGGGESYGSGGGGGGGAGGGCVVVLHGGDGLGALTLSASGCDGGWAGTGTSSGYAGQAGAAGSIITEQIDV